MRIAYAAAVAVGVFFGGCTTASDADIESAVRDTLRDPDSAKFSDIAKEGGGLIACGYVNARNGMGGYVGDTPFMLWKDQVYFQDSDSGKDVAACCSIMLDAVRDRVDSANAPGFNSTCSSIIDHFAWGAGEIPAPAKTPIAPAATLLIGYHAALKVGSETTAADYAAKLRQYYPDSPEAKSLP